MTRSYTALLKKGFSIREKGVSPSVLNKTVQSVVSMELNTYLWKNLLSDKDYPILPQLNAVNKMVNGIMHI